MRAPEQASAFRLESWLVEPFSNRISIPQRPGSGRSVEPRLMQLLELLASRPGEVLGRDELMSTLWPRVVVNENSLTRAVSELRKLLSDAEAGMRGRDFIETIPKRGYRLTVPVEPVSEPGPSADQSDCPATARATVPPAALPCRKARGRAAVLALAPAILVVGIVLGRWLEAPAPEAAVDLAGPDQPVATQPSGTGAAVARTAGSMPDAQLTLLGETTAPLADALTGGPDLRLPAEFALPGAEPVPQARPVVSHDGTLLASVSYTDEEYSVQLSSTRMPAAAVTLYRSQDLIYNLQWSPLDNALLFAKRPRYSETAARDGAEAELILFSLDSLSARVIDSTSQDWRGGDSEAQPEFRPAPEDRAQIESMNIT